MYKVPCLLAAALIVQAFAAPAPGETSRYDPANARSLTPEEAQHFGPQDGKFRYDSRMIRAAEIAASRANLHSTRKCWRSVKDALVAAKALPNRPDTVYAKQAATELPSEYGFKRLPVRNPYLAPIGSVLVYGGAGAGHVELRTRAGFVSDFFSAKPSTRPLLGVFVKPEA
jgi:hypothetical protein